MFHRVISCLLVAALGGLLTALGSPAAAHTSSRSYPVILVHGYSGGILGGGCAGYNVGDYWRDTESTLRNLGWTGDIVGLKYYQCDTDFDASLDRHGSHSAHFPGGSSAHAGGSHTPDADIRHLAYHLAWYIHDTYSRHGVTVQLIGHSMGGLIARSMIQEFEADHPDYPATLQVQDVVTWGTPHNGGFLGCTVGLKVQARQMCANSSYISHLNTNGNPQASQGTDWTIVGSNGDNTVSKTSATHMGPVHKAIYVNPALSHSGYKNDTSLTDNATVDRSDNGSAFTRVTNTHHAIRWADRALFGADW